jgi:hypothetical protein
LRLHHAVRLGQYGTGAFEHRPDGGEEDDGEDADRGDCDTGSE